MFVQVPTFMLALLTEYQCRYALRCMSYGTCFAVSYPRALPCPASVPFLLQP